MKVKAALCMLIASLMSIGSNAFAAEYDLEKNIVSGVDDLFYTILIYRKDGNEIVYVDQAGEESCFSEVSRFYLSETPDPGEYVMVMGGGKQGKSKTISFSIGIPVSSSDLKYTKKFIEEDGTAFAWEDVEGDYSYKTIIIVTDSGIFGYDIGTEFSGAVNIGLHIGTADGINITDAYLSSSAIENGKLRLAGGQ